MPYTPRSSGGAFDPASPGPIGGTTPGAGTFTPRIIVSDSGANTDQIVLHGTGGSSTTDAHLGQFADTAYLYSNAKYRSGWTQDDAAKASMGMEFGGSSLQVRYAIPGGAPSTVMLYDSQISGGTLRIGDSVEGLFYGGIGQFHARRQNANATNRIATVGDGSYTNYLAFDRARGTFQFPAAVQSGDRIGSIVGVAAYDGGPAMAHGAQLYMYADEDWDATHQGSSWEFFSTPIGTTTQTSTLILRNGRVNIPNCPTSTSGLSSGDVWSDGGTLKIIP